MEKRKKSSIAGILLVILLCTGCGAGCGAEEAEIDPLFYPVHPELHPTETVENTQ